MKWIKNNLLLLLIIIQPFLDVFAYFSMNTKYSIIPFLIRSITLFATTVYSFFFTSNNKYRKYVVLVTIFGTCHFINSYFVSNVSLVDDIKEFVRVFYMPLLTTSIFVCVKDNDKAFTQIKNGITINLVQIFSIIMLNVITGEIVYTYSEGIGLRGWFYNSNSQSVILCFCVPFVLYYIYKKNNILMTILFSAISFFLLYSNGTTGCYLLLIPTFGLLMYDIVFTNKNMNKLWLILLCLPLLCTVVLHKYSPDYRISHLTEQSINETKKEQEEIEKKPGNVVSENNKPGSNKPNTSETPNKDSNISTGKTNEQKLIDHYFDKQFVKDYGYETIIDAIGDKMTIDYLVNNRYRKKLVASVIFNSSSLTTKLLGFEFQKCNQYGVDLETDYSAILYYFGYIGFIIYLLLPLYVLSFLIKELLKNIKIVLDSEFILLLSMFTMLNLFAELSGSLLKRPNASIYLGLLFLAILFKFNRSDTSEKKECNK